MEITFPIPTPEGSVSIKISNGIPLFILGRNGTGKSALVHYLQNQCRQLASESIIYIPGSRPSYFDHDSLSMTANSRTQFESNSANWDSSPDVRTRPVSGTSKNERAIFDLQVAELQYHLGAAKQIGREGPSSSAIALLQSKSSPLDRANRLLVQANIPVQTVIENGEIKAKRGSNTYSISKMSDGERIALILIADVISAKRNSIILIDEPELHLHRAIISPLLSALLKERPDCTAIVSTHELTLPNDHPKSQIILVRNCSWSNGYITSWNINLLTDHSQIPDDLKIDILGSKQKILFIEGDQNSRDQPLYSIMFPKVSLRHKGSCSDVRRAVVGLKETEDLHHALAFGLVDNDSMNALFKGKLLEDKVYALDVFSVESLYYSNEVLSAVAQRQADTFSADALEMLSAAKNKSLITLSQPKKLAHLASRVAERRFRDILLCSIPTREKIANSGDTAIEVLIKSPYPDILDELKRLVDERDLKSIIKKYPVRESGVLSDIAKSLRFAGEGDYEKAALVAIGNDSILLNSLKNKLGDLSKCLD